MDFFKYLAALKAERELLLGRDILDDPEATARRLAQVNAELAAGKYVIETARARAKEMRKRLGLPDPRKQKYWLNYMQKDYKNDEG